MTELTREQKLALIWRHKHADFKGKFEGEKMVLKMIPGSGTCSVPLATLSDEQIADENIPYLLKLEAKRKERQMASKSKKAAEAAIQKAVTGFQIPMMSIPKLYGLLETMVAAGAGEEKLKATVAEFPGVVVA